MADSKVTIFTNRRWVLGSSDGKKYSFTFVPGKNDEVTDAPFSGIPKLVIQIRENTGGTFHGYSEFCTIYLEEDGEEMYRIIGAEGSRLTGRGGKLDLLNSVCSMPNLGEGAGEIRKKLNLTDVPLIPNALLEQISIPAGAEEAEILNSIVELSESLLKFVGEVQNSFREGEQIIESEHIIKV